MTRRAVFPAALLITIAALALLAGVLESSFSLDSAAADLGAQFLPPSFTHLFGTDELGRDIFIRLLYGARISLGVGLVSALMASLLGTGVGITAGYAGGAVDAALMRFTDLLIALPLLPLLIILSAIDLAKLGAPAGVDFSLLKIILLISLMGWTTTARLVRARTLNLKKMDFVRAARALGVGPMRIVLRHILPNLMNTVIVATALAAGHFILLESVLSFLGLGLQPPRASWGNMLTNAEDNIWAHPALAVYPGLMIFMTVLALNFLADALQTKKR